MGKYIDLKLYTQFLVTFSDTIYFIPTLHMLYFRELFVCEYLSSFDHQLPA